MHSQLRLPPHPRLQAPPLPNGGFNRPSHRMAVTLICRCCRQAMPAAVTSCHNGMISVAVHPERSACAAHPGLSAVTTRQPSPISSVRCSSGHVSSNDSFSKLHKMQDGVMSSWTGGSAHSNSRSTSLVWNDSMQAGAKDAPARCFCVHRSPNQSSEALFDRGQFASDAPSICPVNCRRALSRVGIHSARASHAEALTNGVFLGGHSLRS